MELFCNKCNAKLTRSPLDEADPKTLNYTDQEELLPEGKYFLAENSEIHFNVEITYLVNTKSMRIMNHSDSSKLSGCCGPGDLGTLNQVCSTCGHEVGLIVGDCWIPHFIGISQNATRLEPLW
jgi:hypothetical protein